MYITADILHQIYCSRYITEDILWQMYYTGYYGRYITAYIYRYIHIYIYILRQISYGRYITADIYITADTLRHTYYSRYIIKADILRHRYYGRCFMADTLWPIYCVQQKRPYLYRFIAPEALDCYVRSCSLGPIGPKTPRAVLPTKNPPK